MRGHFKVKCFRVLYWSYIGAVHLLSRSRTSSKNASLLIVKRFNLCTTAELWCADDWKHAPSTSANALTFLLEQTAATGNGNKRPNRTIPSADNVCCFWRSSWMLGSGSNHCFLLRWKRHFLTTLIVRTASLKSYQWLNSGLNSGLPVKTTWRFQDKPQLRPQLFARTGFVSDIVMRLVQSHTSCVPAIGISCSTCNVNFDWAGLHYFWQ